MTLTVSPEMSRRDEFDTWSTLRGYLARQLVSGRLAVVLGAGVSSHFGLPTWEALITSLYSGRGGVPPDKPATFQAEDFRNKYHSRDQDSFLADVKETLYKGIDISFSRMMSHHTFSGILSILMASGPGTRTEVVSFNWDNLLEKYLALHGRVVASVFEEIHWAQSADVAIFHPHGYLPYGEITRSEKVIFDQLSYDEIMGSETIWRQVLLSLFRTRTCVLVGLSGEDQHLSALLYRVKKEHASFVNRTLFWAVAFTTSESSRGSWESRGVYPIVLTDYKELPLKLFDITEAAVGIRSKQGV